MTAVPMCHPVLTSGSNGNSLMFLGVGFVAFFGETDSVGHIVSSCLNVTHLYAKHKRAAEEECKPYGNMRGHVRQTRMRGRKKKQTGCNEQFSKPLKKSV